MKNLNKHQIKTSNQWLDKPNPYSLDATRVLTHILANIKKKLDFPKPDQTTEDILIIKEPLQKIIELFPVFFKDKNKYLRLKKCIENELLTTKAGYVYNKNDKDYKVIGAVFTSAEVNPNIVTLRINPDIVKHININTDYSLSYLEIISKLNLNQINFYNMINRHAFKSFVLLSIEKIKKMLRIKPNQYQTNSMLIQRIINPCIDAANQHSNLNIAIKKNKNTKIGRKITHLYFEISYKNKLQKIEYQNQIETPEAILKNKFKTIGLPFNIAASLNKFSSKLLNTVADKVIRQQQQKRINNIKNYFFYILKKEANNNKVNHYQGYLTIQYLKSLTPKQSDELWNKFTYQANNEIKELIDAYQKTNESAKQTLDKEIHKHYRQWIFENVITQ